MDSIKKVIDDFFVSIKSSKRVVGGVLTVVFMFVYDYAQLESYGIERETVNNFALTVAALIIGDSLRGVNPEKTDSD